MSIDAEFQEIVDQLSAAFARGSAATRARATHALGIAARGRLKIVDQPKFPAHHLLRAGETLEVLLRHANVKGFRDDAIWDARGATLRFLDATGSLAPGVHDLLMNTGEGFPTGTAAEFYEFFVASPAEKRQLVATRPRLGPGIAGALRNPASYCDLQYHSQIAFRFRSTSGDASLVRFRLRPADERPEGGLIDSTQLVPGSDHVPRQPKDSRPTNYLRSDFSHRVATEGVRYRLELQLRPEHDAPADALDCTLPWDVQTYPWWEVGRLLVDRLVPSEEVEGLQFSPSPGHPDLALIPAQSAHEPASIGHLRSLLYARVAAARLAPAPSTPKNQYPYRAKLPTFDPLVPLPKHMTPSRRYAARAGLVRLPEPLPASPPEPAICITGVNEVMGQNFIDWMPANLTRLRLDKDSDTFFCERRLNGFNAGQLVRVRSKDWQYEATYDTTAFAKEPGGLLPDVISARFKLAACRLAAHSIEYTMLGVTRLLTPKSSDWDFAKRLFRAAEFLFQETQSHLARCHLNVEQYAMAFYRNIDKNPIAELLGPHFEGVLAINKLGSSLISGPNGIIASASPLDHAAVDSLLEQELRRLTWRWTPAHSALPDKIENNHFDRAASAMWEVLREYVHQFFSKQRAEIERCWTEIAGFSQDLVEHGVLDPSLGSLNVGSMGDLEQLCLYVIFHATFLHSWTNGKQWDDGGDPDYASLGFWDMTHPEVNPAIVHARRAAQVRTGWNLAMVHYNPIMSDGPMELRRLLDRAQAKIEPGIPISSIMMSINI